MIIKPSFGFQLQNVFYSWLTLRKKPAHGPVTNAFSGSIKCSVNWKEVYSSPALYPEEQMHFFSKFPSQMISHLNNNNKKNISHLKKNWSWKRYFESGVRKVIYDSSPKTSFPHQKEGRRSGRRKEGRRKGRKGKSHRRLYQVGRPSCQPLRVKSQKINEPDPHHIREQGPCASSPTAHLFPCSTPL